MSVSRSILNIKLPQPAPRLAKGLTHVELANEARHVAVLEILGQNFFGEAALITYEEAGPTLPRTNDNHPQAGGDQTREWMPLTAGPYSLTVGSRFVPHWEVGFGQVSTM